jgi:carbamoyl-phosphate synthase large subunit
MNVQYAIKDGETYILEVNPRASRTVPFVAKVIGEPVAGYASRIMAGETLAALKLKKKSLTHVAVKEAIFPFGRFQGVDPILGPEMRSTGEVMGIDRDPAMAFAKAQIGVGSVLPTSGTVFVSVKESDKDRILPAMKTLVEAGFKVVATRGTKRHLEANGVPCGVVNKVLEGRPHVVDAIKNGDIDLVFNTTSGTKSVSDSKDIRRTALLRHIPCYTTLSGMLAAAQAIKALKADTLQVAPLQSYVGRTN